MHGARLKLADGKIAQLRVAASDEGGFLRIKVEIPVSDTPKPIMISVPMFETTLMVSDHCNPELLNGFAGPIPAEIEGDRLFPLYKAFLRSVEAAEVGLSVHDAGSDRLLNASPLPEPAHDCSHKYR